VRRLALFLAAGLAVAAPAFAQTSATATLLSPELREAADSVVALSRAPVGTATNGEQADRLRAVQAQRTDRIVDMLSRIDPGTLQSRDERLLFDNVRETLAGSVAGRTCRMHLWYAPNPFAGWHISASNWARNVPVGDSASRQRALVALRAIPNTVRLERTMLQRGLDSGVVSSQQVIAVAIRQFRDLLPDDARSSPLAAPVSRDTSDTFATEYVNTLRDSLYPVAREYTAWLETHYMPRARRDGSLRTLENAGDCYRATMRERTSTDSDPALLMRESRLEIERISRTLEPMMRRLTNTDVSDGVRVLKSDPRFTFASRDSTLAAYREMTARAATRIDRVMAGFAAESVVVIPYPEFQERAGLPPSYQRAPDDRSRPAWFLVNLSRPERMAVANAVAHEAYPGHHLQRIAAARATDIHPVMRTLSVSAFTEGWGIYAEDLGAEMGLYTTPLDSVGHLVHLLDVAVAYYLDAGAHINGWDRNTLIDSMYVLGGRTRAQAADYADRHAATPGQLATYYVGYRVIRSARARAEAALGARFSLPHFNREVVRHGTITLASLESNVDAWIADQRATPESK
jgi:uncharacterized protein (DUF885 family)